MIDYSSILITNYGNKQWSLSGNSYDGLTWLDSSPKPTKEELDSLWEFTQDTLAKADCKFKAKQLLASTDWSILPDVTLINKSNFETYRAELRELVLNPVVNPTFPTEPTPVWN